MKSFRKPMAVAVAGLALAVLPATAVAHDGSHPFSNCTEAYENGHANIPETDEHYGKHLDRDEDGIGCDQPPADFVPAGDDDAAGQEGTDLAETGGDSTTLYLAGGGAAVLLAGGGVLYLTARRRNAN
ncbi:LAETG motif-containing sortase-dependent surface protein [Streptomyces sp. NPDC057877]|uniref:LAETG motif-containing sortase-dependent surface protein n=1 Tax=Streptomyces sp. NPDC057877 TaxID=3346269 RepID=UPI0036CCA87D